MAKTIFNDTPPQGTIVTADFLNAVNNHRHGGQAVDGDGAIDYGVTAGSGNAYTLTLVPALTANINGMPIRFKADRNNTGAATLNINGIGAVAVKKGGSTALEAGDLVSGRIYEVLYDGTNFQLMPGLLVSAFIKTVLDDLSASAVLSTLGVSTFIKTLIDDADAATARATLGVGPANPFGALVVAANNTVYLAGTDGFVFAYNSVAAASGYDLRGYSDGSNPPGTLRSICVGYNAYTYTTGYYSIMFPVIKGRYWKVTGCGTVYWLPVGS